MDKGNQTIEDGRRRFGCMIRRHREHAGLTQGKLANAAGLSATTIRAIEAGGRNVNFTTLLALARALGVTPSDLLMRERTAMSFEACTLFERSPPEVQKPVLRLLRELAKESPLPTS